jgi:hypothetical protein
MENQGLDTEKDDFIYILIIFEVYHFNTCLFFHEYKKIASKQTVINEI